MPKKKRQKKLPEFHYFEISLEFEEDSGLNINTEGFSSLVEGSVLKLFGHVGGDFPVDVIEYKSSAKVGLVKVPSLHSKRFWSSITLFHKLGSMDCAFRVHQVSSDLQTLLTNSKNFQPS